MILCLDRVLITTVVRHGLMQNLASQPKSFFENVLIKAISQKGANIYQNFKVTKVVPQEGTNYVTCDFRYELLTGAGFEVDRRGVASITSEGPAVEALWTASTRQRYEKIYSCTFIKSWLC